MSVDAARLSEGERRALLQLAEGHTVKSIAALDGVSVHSVNERLREARRKTGIASSRELARLVRAERDDGEDTNSQKICDEKMGVAAPCLSPPALLHTDRHDGDRPWSKGVIAMTFFVLGGAALATVLIAVGQVAPTVSAAPRVTATTPTQGARAAPGRLTISVTFDQPMRADSYSFIDTGLGLYPDCAPKPHQSADRRSFVLDCKVEAGKAYAIGFNGGRFRNFVGVSGLPAEPALLRFTSYMPR